MSFDKVKFSEKLKQENGNIIFDGSIVFKDPSSFIKRDELGNLIFNDPSNNQKSLYELANVSDLDMNLSNVLFISVNGTSNGQRGNFTKPFDISTAVNVEAQDGDLLYVLPGDYLFAQELTPRDIDNWRYYFSPNASIDFGDASLVGTAALIGRGGVDTFVYGYGNFKADNSFLVNLAQTTYFEFDTIDLGKEFSVNQPINFYMKGNTINLTTNNLGAGIVVGGYVDVNNININNKGRFELVGTSNSIIKFNKIFSNDRALYFNASHVRYKVIGNSIDSSSNCIDLVNNGAGRYTEVNINKLNLFGIGRVLDDAPINSSFTFNTVTSSDIGIVLDNTHSVHIKINKLIADNFALSSSSRFSGLVEIGYLESINNNAISFAQRLSQLGTYGAVFDIDQIKCSSVNRGIDFFTVTTQSASEEVLFKNSHIDAGFPIYIRSNHPSEYDNIKMRFEDMLLYSSGDQNSVFTSSYDMNPRFINVYANTAPHPNVKPLWDGINVSDKVGPINN